MKLPGTTLSPRAARYCAALLCYTLPVAALAAQPSPPPQQTAAERRNAELNESLALLSRVIEQASAVCLSNESRTSAVQLRGSLLSITKAIAAGGSAEVKTNVLRGARDSLPLEFQHIENARIRECMKQYISPLVAIVINAVESTSTPQQWPEPIDFRFNFKRTTSTDPKFYSENVRLNLIARERPLSRRITMQDAQDMAYYQYDVPYPRAGEVIRGTIVAERLGNSRLSLKPPVVTEFCVKQPAKLPKHREIAYDIFDCIEGKSCKPSPQTTTWLDTCDAKPIAGSYDVLDWLIGTAHAAEPPAAPAVEAAKSPAAPFWHVPSLQTLAGSKQEGVGYTLFTIQTDAFLKQDVNAVEVDVRVNNVPVLEDGLPPQLRPVPNDPDGPYKYNFALQSLNFQGAVNGCDRIDIKLTPQQGKGKALQTALAYVALRDVAPRTQKLGDATLTWSASYIVPTQAWRYYAVVHSYAFAAHNSDGRKAAVASAGKDKKLLDALQLKYGELKLVGVIRPPRTVNSQGSAAYGMAIGLVQDDGQVRFTFSQREASKLANFVLDQRRRHAKLRSVVAPQPFFFNADGGSRTAVGMCEDNQL